MNPPIQTWSALLIGDTNGILAAPGSTWDGHPEHCERTELVRKRELDAALLELSSYRKCCRECDKILDALPDATEDPIYIQLQRIINERDLANDTIKGMEGNLEACEKDNEWLRARISELERRNKELSSQDGRRFGRMEAAKALLEHDPDDLDDLIGSREVADTGDFASYWITEAVLNLFDVDSESSTLENLDGENFRLWHENHELEMDRNRLLLRLKEIRNLNCTDEILNPPMTMCATEAIAIKALNHPPTQ